MPWLLAGADLELLAGGTRTQLAVERERLGLTAEAAVEAGGVAVVAVAMPRVRVAHWIEFYSLGNLHMCGGKQPHTRQKHKQPAPLQSFVGLFC